MIENWTDIDGWFSEHDAEIYNMIVDRYTNAKFIEIGVWKGRSFASVIDKLLKNNYNEIYVADHWLGAPTERTTSQIEVSVSDIFDIFSTNLKELGFNGKYNPLKMDSISASKQFADEYFDVIFIDGDHEYESVKEDLLKWYPKLKIGGTICGHDKDYPPVEKALKEVFNLDFKSIKGNIWYCGKP